MTPSFSSDLSTSFATQLNTKLNTGSAGFESVLGHLIGGGHLKFELTSVVIKYSNGNGERKSKSSIDININGCNLHEWISEITPTSSITSSSPPCHHRAYNSYQPIIDFDISLTETGVRSMYEVLRKESMISSCTRVGSGKGAGGLSGGTGLATLRGGAVGRGRNPVIKMRYETSEDKGPTLTVDLCSMHLHLDIKLFDRTENYFKSSPSLSPSLSPSSSLVDYSHSEHGKSSQSLKHNKAVLQISVPVIRTWIYIPDMSGINSKEGRDWAHVSCSILKELFVVDLIKAKISTEADKIEKEEEKKSNLSGPTSSTVPLESISTRDESRIVNMYDDCTNYQVNGSDIGASIGFVLLNSSKHDKNEFDLFPFLYANSFTSPNTTTTTTTATSFPSSTAASTVPTAISSSSLNKNISFPSFEIVLRSEESIKRSVDLTDRGPLSPKDFLAPQPDEERPIWGFQSWYDIGNKQKVSTKKSQILKGGDKDVEEDELSMFKQKTIMESV